FQFQSITPGHTGEMESLAWDAIYRWLVSTGDGHLHVWNFTPDSKLKAITSQLNKQPYIMHIIHFYDNGASLLVSFLESSQVVCYSVEPWDLKWRKKGNFLLMSNLKDGIDKYTVPTLQCIQSYSHVIIHNIPLQISAGLIFIGGDDSFACIFNYSTGAF
ncbi:hypothetical protein BDR06DRAFT_896605, partial [Suillus hirtellus]